MFLYTFPNSLLLHYNRKIEPNIKCSALQKFISIFFN
uniref:Uncharacterized protein n=1 Tax=Myoviridae sp. ctCL221 TaxID=2826630 RepID=A0A8S5M631_9CAUD|nr:MAG TPA: hypothetical protein [Myoviridae sp. ctCL221]